MTIGQQVILKDERSTSFVTYEELEKWKVVEDYCKY